MQIVIEQFQGSATDARSRAIGLKTAPTPTATSTAIGNKNGVAQLTRIACSTMHELTINHNATADARTKREHDKMPHTTGTTIDQLAIGSRVGIVGNRHRNIEMLMDESLQVGNALEIKVCGILDATRIIISHRRSNADAVNLLDIIALHQLPDAIAHIRDINLSIVVFLSRQVSAVEALAVVTDKANIGIGATNINSN